MNINGVPFRTIWVKPDDSHVIQIIDQRRLPYEIVIEDIASVDEMVRAIKEMHVRGAPLIGVAAAYGIYLALLEAPQHLEKSAAKLRESRPTAVNLEWAIQTQLKAIATVVSSTEKIKTALETANHIADDDVAACQKIGEFGLKIIEEISRKKKNKTVNILTHCNAGWLACVDWGTATAPIYKAFHQKIDIHVWVDVTGPRNQGARLTAWELLQHGVPHTVIADNTGGHLMQRGRVDLVLVGTDRTASNGDVANKIGTYLKALAAKDNAIPFYVAAPSSSIDWTIYDGLREIPIEERDADEVKFVDGWCEGGLKKVLIMPEKSAAKNYAFDVTPAKFVTSLITERGICQANRESLLRLFPEKRDEGVIKFNCHWIKTNPLPAEAIKNLNSFRNRLFDLGFIGVYPDGIGFGNISIRASRENEFIISGTQTGGIPKLNEQHYTKVVSANLEENSITCEGPVKASSESLTHAGLYDLSPKINAIIHIHHKNLWEELRFRIPTTGEKIPYGTPAMAREMKRLFGESDLKQRKIFVMAGHQDGIVTFGENLEEAFDILCSEVFLRSQVKLSLDRP